MTETRFAFGQNWSSFLDSLDQDRIDQATRSLCELLCLGRGQGGTEALASERPLEGKTFLDIGSGSGLFSLAAHRLGADVVSVDYDADCVHCTQDLCDRFGRGRDGNTWRVVRGSVLDPSWMQSLGTFDIVYSWGVLHHTGQMATAIRHASERVGDGGILAVSIYNDQGGASRRWLTIKRVYHRLPRFLRSAWVVAIASWYETKFAVARLLRLRNPLPFDDWRAKKRDRGMSAWHDWVDWVGGLPFEVARPEEVILPLVDRQFSLINLKTVGSGWGCNEFVFRRVAPSPLPQVTPRPAAAPGQPGADSPDG
ncbi:class I SAM-dependent methyltransferase [Roseiconus nitratireducens]|uniref:Class I SAM-dependent methyltransferase n=1 Tax=Roseiconus nitratireducens TaxID=2605748 RepID=A0A5M6D9W4_9BACT|nr:class I SAM-dependent methyltransferase [Roseiconus nitratireducens]KAA5542749.1 class I SAM-dependent methyltransferase [Roseiconus nitratireducens]